MLIAHIHVYIIAWWLYDDEFLYNGKSTPQIYHIIAHIKNNYERNGGYFRHDIHFRVVALPYSM